MTRGLLIAFEGIDGAGLSTQASITRKKLEDDFKFAEDAPMTFLTKEPTDGPVGGEIREVLSKRLKVDPETLALMFAADRRDHSEKLEEWIKNGKIALADRYYLSSLAYQGLEVDDLEWLQTINSKCMKPDLTIFLDVSVDEAINRINQDRIITELYEKESKLEEIKKNYDNAIDFLKTTDEDIRIVNGERKEEEVNEDVMEHIYHKMDEDHVNMM